MFVHDIINPVVDSTSTIVTILNKLGNTSFFVKDFKNRKFIIEGASTFKIGQTVTIKNGVIVGFTKNLKSFTDHIV